MATPTTPTQTTGITARATRRTRALAVIRCGRRYTRHLGSRRPARRRRPHGSHGCRCERPAGWPGRSRVRECAGGAGGVGTARGVGARHRPGPSRLDRDRPRRAAAVIRGSARHCHHRRESGSGGHAPGRGRSAHSRPGAIDGADPGSCDADQRGYRAVTERQHYRDRCRRHVAEGSRAAGRSQSRESAMLSMKQRADVSF